MPSLPAVRLAACLPVLEALAAGLDADEPDVLVVEKAREHADGVAAAADAGDDHVGQSADLIEALLPGLAADAALEVLDDGRVGVRAGRRAEQVERVGHVWPSSTAGRR